MTAVDDSDFEELIQYKWCAHRKGKKVYAVRANGLSSMHAHLMGPRRAARIDHIDGDGLNNQRNNLRWATVAQNSMNRTCNRNSRTGYKGVVWCASKRRFRVVLKTAGKQISGGYYSQVEQAVEAHVALARLHHGEFAKT
jgi:hypothetical protein